MKYDCLIIGAGLSGLTAAVIMAQKGYQTAVLEKSPHIGPTIRGFRREGIFFDTGFHYTGALHDGGPLDIFFRYLGMRDGIEPIPYNPDGFDIFRCLDPPFEFPFPYGYHRIRERLAAAFPGEERAVDSYLQQVREAYRSKPYINLDPARSSLGLPIVNGPSLGEVLDNLTKDRLLKGVLSMHCLLHGVTPDKVPFFDHAVVAGSYYESVHAVKGGGTGLLRAFEERLKDLGVDIYCNREVREIFIGTDLAVSGLGTAGGERFEGRCCISTLHPQQLLGIVPREAFRPSYRRRLEELEDTCSAVIVFARLRGEGPLLDRANLFLLPHPEFPDPDETEEVEQKLLFVSPVYGDGEGAVQEGVVVICPFPHTGSRNRSSSFPEEGSSHYDSFKKEMCGRIMGHLEASCPEFRERMTVVECSTPRTLKRFTNSPFGSLYGVKHQIDQINPLPVTKVKGLFLAGQSIIAPGMLGAMISAFVACGAILGHDRLRKELRSWA
jgi:all-trans-retinol 13,14-reductase